MESFVLVPYPSSLILVRVAIVELDTDSTFLERSVWYVVSHKWNKRVTEFFSMDVSRIVRRLVEAKEVAPSLLQSLKEYCKQGDDECRNVFGMFYHHVQRRHAQIRYQVLQLLSDFVPRSQTFRTLFLQHGEELVQLWTDDVEPRFWNDRLHQRTSVVLRSFCDRFGDRFPRFRLLLDQCGQNPPPPEPVDPKERMRYQKYLALFQSETEPLLVRVQECIRDLDTAIVELGSTRTETTSNQHLFDSFRKIRSTLMHFRVKVDRWMSWVCKVHDDDSQRYERNLKSLIDIKAMILDAVQRGTDVLDDVVVEDEEEEFVDVDDLEVLVRGEDSIGEKRRELVPFMLTQDAPGLKPVFPGVVEGILPEEPVVRNPKRKEWYEKAPVVPFDRDLEFWGQEHVSVAQVSQHSGLEYHHRFLGDSSDQPLSGPALESLQKRLVYLPSTSKVEYPPCRAPLRNGTLCKRRDMERCPFHGPIIPRDDVGTPLDASTSNPKVLSTWEQIAKELQLESPVRPKRRRTELDPVGTKPSVQKRLLRKSKRISRKAAPDLVLDYQQRDRNAFRWQSL
jgi:hypothetical protein